MKSPICPVVFALLGLLTPMQAQNLMEALPALEQHATEGSFKVQGTPSEDLPLIAAQNSKSLESTLPKSTSVDAVANMGVLTSPSPYRAVAAGKAGAIHEVPAEQIRQDLAIVSATYRAPGTPESDCNSIALSIEQRLKLDSSLVLQTVEREVAANPGCSCEIVKAAIRASDADVELVVSIVEVAITVAPESMRIISQCAIASMPEALGGIQSLLARYDGNTGDAGYSSKGAKSAKSAKGAKNFFAAVADQVAAMPNPLDFPGSGPVGPTRGGPGGQPLLPVFPPVILPAAVTEVSL